MIDISAVIITYNEEKNIARCINSLKDVVSEIVVVDSYSTDATVEIAKGLGAKIYYKEFNGYGEQKDFAQNQAEYNWILSLDADEAISKELSDAIMDMRRNPVSDAYKLNILTNFCGKWIYHCGWYPQYKIRLWDRTKGSMSRNKLHEGWYVADKNAKIGKLKGNILHYSYNTISDYIKKLENYSDIKARMDVEKGKKVSFFRMWIAPKWEFFISYFVRQGFRDGYYGYIISKNTAFASFVRYAKTRQYSKKQKAEKSQFIQA
jgi:glycosyltransferase involved in cell wall biosynthesis